MTPFADYLFQLRRARGLRQRQLADRLGLGSSYISALEACRKEPPAPIQLQRLIRALELPSAEADELIRLAELSRSRIDIPNEASKDEFVLMHELAEQLGSLTSDQVAFLRMFLRMNRQRSERSVMPVAEVCKESAM